MLPKKRKLAEAKPPPEQLKARWNVLLEDLRFLTSVALAHFIVWRTLRRRYRENAARRREFKLLRGEGSLAQAQPQVVRGFDWRANGSQTAIGAHASAVGKEAKSVGLIFVALTVLFFLIALVYVRGCEKLR